MHTFKKIFASETQRIRDSASGVSAFYTATL